MSVEENSYINKSWYKAILVILKYIPMLLALNSMVDTFLWASGIDLPVFAFIGSLSIIPWIFIYLASIVFRFCIYHRMFLWYIAVDNVLSTVDYYFEIGFGPVPYLVLIGIVLFIVSYLYQREKKNESCSKKPS